MPSVTVDSSVDENIGQTAMVTSISLFHSDIDVMKWTHVLDRLYKTLHFSEVNADNSIEERKVGS